MTTDAMAIPMIKIPSNDDMINKFYYASPTYKSHPIHDDNSLWGSVIYEFWDGHSIYEDLKSSITQYIAEIDCAICCKDFSLQTTKELDSSKALIIEGVRVLKTVNEPEICVTDLIKPLQTMIDMTTRYMKVRDVAKRVVQLENRMIQLQIDIQTHMYIITDMVGMIGTEHVKKSYVNQFFEERSSIKMEMKRLEEKGAGDVDMKKLKNLYRGIRQEMADFDFM
jgi:hypothetical protein